ncbi:hypothetical protein [Gimesia fumaroli]|uniref:Uncharacterized protein n=1 Tax=Gimesia fumaroli TaxID=2527976 RepID=A0A518IKS1_9PLAN|nr:hypothetical protein [Gimesia fumaroli]QDV53698.1 hypothetical protein Enr17x_57790 [Gimesia fumaroli]
MASFTDTQEREWVIEITLGVARKVKSETNVDLLAALRNPESANKLMQKLADDPESLGQVIYVAAKSPDEGLTADDLFDALDHEAANAAFNALDDAMTDFFPPQVRGRLKRAKKRVKDIMQTESNRNLAEIDEEIDSEEFEQKILESIRGKSSTASQAS